MFIDAVASAYETVLTLFFHIYVTVIKCSTVTDMVQFQSLKCGLGLNHQISAFFLAGLFSLVGGQNNFEA